MINEEKSKELRKTALPNPLHDGYGMWLRSSDRVIDWLNTHHFDYLGLIDMGLALEAPEDMYKHE